MSKPLHMAVGIFDGLHLGHQSVIETALHSAELSGGEAGVLTFWPHPSRLFRPDNPVGMIQSPEDKERQLKKMGIERLEVETFDKALAGLEPMAYLEMLKTKYPSLASLHVGRNWRFGKGRSGDVRVLVELSSRLGIRVMDVERLHLDGAPVSSTRIREQLLQGNMEEVSTLLGRAYQSYGKVQAGRRIGRTLGFPTLNFPWERECQPPFGVYKVKARDNRSGICLPGIANFGLRPTVEDAAVEARLEVYCPEFSEPFPWDKGDFLEVDWLSFLRRERKFESLEALKRAIAEDVKRAGFHRS